MQCVRSQGAYGFCHLRVPCGTASKDLKLAGCPRHIFDWKLLPRQHGNSKFDISCADESSPLLSCPTERGGRITTTLVVVATGCNRCRHAVVVKTQGSASPVFPQLGLEPNHAGLASQSLFLLEELLQSKTQWHSKNILKLLELFKKSSELSQTSSKVLQIKRLQLKLKITYQSHLKITCS